mgnify:CR=1 FL=1
MVDLSKLSDQTSEMLLDLVQELQPVSAEQVRQALAERTGEPVELAAVVRYLEFLRSGFPRKTAHAGPERWIVVELG